MFFPWFFLPPTSLLRCLRSSFFASCSRETHRHHGSHNILCPVQLSRTIERERDSKRRRNRDRKRNGERQAGPRTKTKTSLTASWRHPAAWFALTLDALSLSPFVSVSLPPSHGSHPPRFRRAAREKEQDNANSDGEAGAGTGGERWSFCLDQLRHN